ncbi:site-specific integrase [Flavicella sp.]|nr:site-specific integrase [Flavicella sp.]MDA9111296.1 site-specific integrase [Flavicella sp.]
MSNLKVTIGYHKNKPFINVYINKIRYRFWNGECIKVKIKCIDNPPLLKAAFELKLREGWRPQPKKKIVKEVPITVIQALEKGIQTKTAQGCSERFIKDAKRVVTLWRRYESKQQIKSLTLDNLQPSHIRNFLVRPNWSPKTQRTVKSTLSPLLKEFKPSLVQSVKLKKPISTLHKPIDKINEILIHIKEYNSHLHLCCLMTYGCLLRPHREIRELTWEDFSEDLTYIHLSGNRNKSGRNRIVPVPSYIRDLLIKGEPQHNIFSGKPQPLNQDYFKTLWSRFKRQSTIIEQDQTLYSFRHSGAIEIFKRTGSITKLQKAMGHSSINVSLTYLRGLEVSDLEVADMPKINLNY